MEITTNNELTVLRESDCEDDGQEIEPETEEDRAFLDNKDAICVEDVTFCVKLARTIRIQRKGRNKSTEREEEKRSLPGRMKGSAGLYF